MLGNTVRDLGSSIKAATANLKDNPDEIAEDQYDDEFEEMDYQKLAQEYHEKVKIISEKLSKTLPASNPEQPRATKTADSNKVKISIV